MPSNKPAVHLVTQTGCPTATVWVNGVAYTVPAAVKRELARLRGKTRGVKALGEFQVYRAGAVRGNRQRTRWKATARNGRKVGNGGEAYVNEADAIAGALLTAHIIATANGYQLVKTS